MPTLPLLSSVTPELASVQLVSVYLTSRFAVLVQGIPPWTGNALPTSGIRTRRARLGSAARASSSIWRNCSGVSDGGVLLTSDSWLLAPGSMFTLAHARGSDKRGSDGERRTGVIAAPNGTAYRRDFLFSSLLFFWHGGQFRSEEHTSELQSQSNIVC